MKVKNYTTNREWMARQHIDPITFNNYTSAYFLTIPFVKQFWKVIAVKDERTKVNSSCRRNNELSNKTQIINNKHTDTILSNQASYAHALSPVKETLFNSCVTQVPWIRK